MIRLFLKHLDQTFKLLNFLWLFDKKKQTKHLKKKCVVFMGITSMKNYSTCICKWKNEQKNVNIGIEARYHYFMHLKIGIKAI